MPLKLIVMEISWQKKDFYVACHMVVSHGIHMEVVTNLAAMWQVPTWYLCHVTHTGVCQLATSGWPQVGDREVVAGVAPISNGGRRGNYYWLHHREGNGPAG